MESKEWDAASDVNIYNIDLFKKILLVYLKSRVIERKRKLFHLLLCSQILLTAAAGQGTPSRSPVLVPGPKLSGHHLLLPMLLTTSCIGAGGVART